MKTRISVALSIVLLITGFPATAEDVNLEVVHLIKNQAFQHSKIMDYIHMLADENGSRVSGSPGYQQAAEKAATA